MACSLRCLDDAYVACSNGDDKVIVVTYSSWPVGLLSLLRLRQFVGRPVLYCTSGWYIFKIEFGFYFSSGFHVWHCHDSHVLMSDPHGFTHFVFYVFGIAPML